jgi:signal transduction histidine kinase
MEDRRRYVWLKILTILGPTIFVAVAEYIREMYLREHFPPYVVSIIVIAATLVAAIVFSWYMFRALESMETERRTYKEALLSLKERERLAREMHDGLSQNLAVLKMEAYKLRSLCQDDDRLTEEMETIDKLINQTYLEVRQTLYDLRATRRLDEGFWPIIARQVSEFERQTGIRVSLTQLAPAEEPWSELASVQILRIIQEALSNVRKHAAATTVDFQCVRHHDRVEFVVRDNGQGFDETAAPSRDHYGLLVMQERAESVGGKVDIQSSVGEGTTVTLVIPIERRRSPSGQSKVDAGR